MRSPDFVSWLERSDANLREGQLYYQAWMSMREEGRSHITFSALELRAAMIKRLMETAKALDPDLGGLTEVALLTEHAQREPDNNPIEKGMTIVQVWLGGQRRLGVRRPVDQAGSAQLQSPQWAPKGAIMHPGISPDEPTDIDMLRRLAEKAQPICAGKRGGANVSGASGNVKVEQGGEEEENNEDEERGVFVSWAKVL